MIEEIEAVQENQEGETVFGRRNMGQIKLLHQVIEDKEQEILNIYQWFKSPKSFLLGLRAH
jgi:hypothetical protein